MKIKLNYLFNFSFGLSTDLFFSKQPSREMTNVQPVNIFKGGVTEERGENARMVGYRLLHLCKKTDPCRSLIKNKLLVQFRWGFGANRSHAHHSWTQRNGNYLLLIISWFL
jgi:hypothetical protein